MQSYNQVDKQKHLQLPGNKSQASLNSGFPAVAQPIGKSAASNRRCEASGWGHMNIITYCGCTSSGWWLSLPSEKNMKVNWDDNRNPILMGK